MTDKVEFAVDIYRLENGRFRIDVKGAGGSFGGPVDTADEAGAMLAMYLRQSAQYGFDVPV